MNLVKLPQSLSLVGDLLGVFRQAGGRFIAQQASLLESVARDTRHQVEDIFSDPKYSGIRMRGLARYFTPTVPSPPLTILNSDRPSSEDLKDDFFPEELRGMDLSSGKVCLDREKNPPVAGIEINLPLEDLFGRIFSREFDVGKNEGDAPQFWAEDVKLSSFLRPDGRNFVVRVKCNLVAVEEYQAFLIAIQTLLGIRNPIEFLLEGRLERRGRALYIPLRPDPSFKLGRIIPLHAFLGMATLILFPLSEERTAFALSLENKPLSKNPDVILAPIAQAVIR